MEEYLELVCVPAIAAIVYWVVAIVRYAVKSNETFLRFVPLISAVLGAAFGIVAFYAVPSIMPAKNVVVALVLGGASGLTATGTHQMLKQLTQKDCSAKAEPDASPEGTKAEEAEKNETDKIDQS